MGNIEYIMHIYSNMHIYCLFSELSVDILCSFSYWAVDFFLFDLLKLLIY